MKKIVIFSVLAAGLFFNTAFAMTLGRPHGHKYYAKHAKHHKAHRLHRSHGIIDATYQN